MPTQKTFKQRVRTRMTKTGESYTAARHQLLRKAGEPETLCPWKPRSTAEASPARRAGADDHRRRRCGAPRAGGTRIGSPSLMPGAQRPTPTPRSPAGSARHTASPAGGPRTSRSTTNAPAASARPHEMSRRLQHQRDADHRRRPRAAARCVHMTRRFGGAGCPTPRCASARRAPSSRPGSTGRIRLAPGRQHRAEGRGEGAGRDRTREAAGRQSRRSSSRPPGVSGSAI